MFHLCQIESMAVHKRECTLFLHSYNCSFVRSFSAINNRMGWLGNEWILALIQASTLFRNQLKYSYAYIAKHTNVIMFRYQYWSKPKVYVKVLAPRNIFSLIKLLAQPFSIVQSFCFHWTFERFPFQSLWCMFHDTVLHSVAVFNRFFFECSVLVHVCSSYSWVFSRCCFRFFFLLLKSIFTFHRKFDREHWLKKLILHIAIFNIRYQ